MAIPARAGCVLAFVERMGDLDGHFERAMVTFLEYPQFWKGATYCSATRTRCPIGASGRGCRTSLRLCMKTVGRRWPTASATTFTARREGVRTVLWRRSAGANLDYFFAYPEDYSQQSLEWVEGEFAPQTAQSGL
jgi:hypothetical protein